MSTIFMVADWVTLLYFCLSTMFAAVVLLFFTEKKHSLLQFVAINWGISNVVNAGWDFVSEQVLFRENTNYWLSLGQLLLSVAALIFAIGFSVLLKETRIEEKSKQTVEEIDQSASLSNSDNVAEETSERTIKDCNCEEPPTSA